MQSCQEPGSQHLCVDLGQHQCHLVQLTVTLLTLEPRGSGLVGLLPAALFDGTRLFTYSEGKWETHAELGEM